MVEWGIAGEESSRKSSCCLLEPRAHTTHPLKLSAGPFINLGTAEQKYAKAHHSLNSHISSNYIPPKLAAKKILTNRANFRKTHIHPKFWKAGRKFEDECVMSGSLHELLRERAAPVQE